MNNIEHLLRPCLKEDDIFKALCHSISTLRTENTRDLKNKKKIIGDIWEDFCKKYLIYVKKYSNVNLVGELTPEEYEKYSLTSRDVGIDMICTDHEGFPIAIQCKFRTRGNVSWKEVSTFEALCARTGTWKYNLIMTNAPRIVREGAKNDKDRSMVFTTFNRIKRHEWLLIAGYGCGSICGGIANPEDDVKQLRLRYFESKKYH